MSRRVRVCLAAGASGIALEDYLFGTMIGLLPGWILLSIILAYASASFSDNMFDYGAVNLYFWGFLGIVFAQYERAWGSAGAARRLGIQRNVRQYGSHPRSHGLSSR